MKTHRKVLIIVPWVVIVLIIVVEVWFPGERWLKILVGTLISLWIWAGLKELWP